MSRCMVLKASSKRPYTALMMDGDEADTPRFSEVGSILWTLK